MNRREQRKILKGIMKKNEEENKKNEFEKINQWDINQKLKEIVLEAYKEGFPVYYNEKNELVTIDYGPLASRGYHAKSGSLIFMS